MSMSYEYFLVLSLSIIFFSSCFGLRLKDIKSINQSSFPSFLLPLPLLLLPLPFSPPSFLLLAFFPSSPYFSIFTFCLPLSSVLYNDGWVQVKASKLLDDLFLGPRCGHCQRLAPTWEELAGKVKDEDVTIAKVDCTQHKSVCDAHQVRKILGIV